MIILIHGEDSFRAKEQLFRLKNEFSKKFDPKGLGIVSFDQDNFTNEKLVQEARSVSLLTPKKLIILKDIEPQILKDLNTGDLASENIILFYFSCALTAKNDFCQKLLQEKHNYHFPLLNHFELKQWVKKRLEKRQVQIDPVALNLLATYVGGNLWQMEQEVQKLIAYESSQIKVDDVKKMVSGKINDDIFTLVDAIALKNKKRALLLFEDQLKLGKDIFYLLAMIIRQFRLLLMVKSWLSQNNGSDHYNQTAKIAALLKLHPYAAKKIFQQARGFSSQSLKKIYKQLLEADFKLKTTKIAPEILLERLIVY